MRGQIPGLAREVRALRSIEAIVPERDRLIDIYGIDCDMAWRSMVWNGTRAAREVKSRPLTPRTGVDGPQKRKINKRIDHRDQIENNSRR